MQSCCNLEREGGKRGMESEVQHYPPESILAVVNVSVLHKQLDLHPQAKR